MHRENDKIERYKTYLRLEKALSANSIDAYLTDLDKLTNFVESEGKKYADVTYDDLQQFVARLHDIGIHPTFTGKDHFRVSNLSTGSCSWTII